MKTIGMLVGLWLFATSLSLAAETRETRLISDQRPLTIVLRKDHEHRLRFPEPVLIEVPEDFLVSAKLLQTDSQVVYITPSRLLEAQRLVALSQDRDRIYLLDISVSEKASLSDYLIEEPSLIAAQTDEEAVPVAKPRNPAPVELTRYAAQALYGPVRLLPRRTPIRPIAAPEIAGNLDLIRSQRGESFHVRTVAAWRGYGLHLVAIEIQNLSPLLVRLDPRLVRGNWVTVTSQHAHLGPRGTPEDKTTLYLVSRNPLVQTLEELAYGRY